MNKMMSHFVNGATTPRFKLRLPIFSRSGNSALSLFPKQQLSHDIWRRKKTSSRIQSRRSTPEDRGNKSRNPAFVRNKLIGELGREQKWKDILLIHQKEREWFNNVNYATTMSQLGRSIRSIHHRRDPSLKAFLDDLASQLETHGNMWMGAQGMANIMHAIGKMKLKNESTRRIVHFVLKKENVEWLVTPGVGTPQNIANSVWSCATLGIHSPPLFSEVEKKAEWLVEEGKPQEVSNIAWACATLGIRSPNIFAQIEENAEWLISEGTPQAIANTVWACATLGIQSPRIFSQVEKHAQKLIEEGKPQEVANSLWSCATLGINCPRLVSELENRAEWFVMKGVPQDVANTIWASATLAIGAPKLFAQIEKHAEWLVNEGRPQEVSNTAWACATNGVASPNIFAHLERRANWLTNEGTPQAVANTVWACAKLGNNDCPQLFSQVEKRAEWLFEGSDPQVIANTVWAYATLGINSPKIFSQLEKRAEWLVKEGDPQTITNTLWACAKLGNQSPKLFAMVEKRAEWLVKNGNPQNVANALWACATLGMDSPDLFSQANNHAESIVEQGKPQEVSNIVWAFASQGYDAMSFFTAIETHIDKLVLHGTVQEICNTCYAMVILDYGARHNKTLLALWTRAIQFNVVDLTDKEYNQLVQVEAFAKADGIGLKEPSPELRLRMDGVVTNNVQSRFQREFSVMLTKVGFIHEEEVAPMEGSNNMGSMLAIDMASREQKIAIEYDGSYHFLRSIGTGNVTRVENGATQAKRRFLERIGWKVINIHYQDWVNAQRKSEGKEWLKRTLSNAGIILKRESN